MRKLICNILVLSIVVTMCMPVAFAGNIGISESSMISVIYNGHGEFELTNTKASVGINNNINSLNEGDVIVVTATDDKEIYKINDKKYLTLVYDDTYLLTDKLDVCIDNYESNERLFDEYSISQDIRDEIRSVITKQKELGNENFKIEIFAPSSTTPGDIQVMGNEPLGTTYYTRDYAGKTFYMRDISTKYHNVKTDEVVIRGSGTLSRAKSFVDFVISITSNFSKTVSAFSLAKSAYDIYRENCGYVGSGSSSDEMKTALIYSWIHKQTVARDILGEYAGSGCSSYKAWLDHHETYQYYREKGEGYLTKSYLNQEIYSEHFRDPAPTAIDYGYIGYGDYFLRTTIHGKSVVLVGH